jgi:hypothetical protein
MKRRTLILLPLAALLLGGCAATVVPPRVAVASVGPRPVIVAPLAPRFVAVPARPWWGSPRRYWR